MNRRTFLLSTTIVFAMPSTAMAELLFVQETNDGYLNLREGPGTQFSIIQRLYDGMQLDVVGSDGNWRRVILPDGTTGWTSARFLASTYSYLYYFDVQVDYTSDGFVNLRAGPGTSYAVQQRLYAGQRLWVREQQGGWARVELADGRTGWAASQYLYNDQ